MSALSFTFLSRQLGLVPIATPAPLAPPVR
jgi:hypothetical protein